MDMIWSFEVVETPRQAPPGHAGSALTGTLIPALQHSTALYCTSTSTSTSQMRASRVVMVSTLN